MQRSLMVTKIMKAAFFHLLTITVKSLVASHLKVLDINPIPVQVSFHFPAVVVTTMSTPYMYFLMSSSF